MKNVLSVLANQPMMIMQTYMPVLLAQMQMHQAIQEEVEHNSLVSKLSPSVAMVRMHGALYAGSWWGLDPERLEQAFSSLLADDSVKEIVIHAKTPGGSVTKVLEAYEALAALSAKKSTTVFNDTMLASGGLFIGSAAREIVTAEAAVNGSLGVIVGHADYSQYLENEGIDLRYIRTGDKKALGQMNDAWDENLTEALNKQVSFWLEAFVSAVAKGRSMSKTDVLNKFALNAEGSLAGGTVYGKEAVKLGLADRVGKFEPVISQIVKRAQKVSVSLTLKGSVKMDVIKAILADESLTDEQKEIKIKAHLDALSAEGKKATAQLVSVQAALGLETLEPDALTALAASAKDGAAFREDLKGRLKIAAIAVYGNDTDGQARAEMECEVWGSQPIGRLTTHVKTLEAQKASMFSPEAVSTDKPEGKAEQKTTRVVAANA